MLDPYLRRLIHPSLNTLGKWLSAFGLSANRVTILGFILGIIAIIMIVMKQYTLAIGFICLNRLFDGLDGAIARHRGLTDFGGFVDIVCDFIVYSGIVFAFGLAKPEHLFYTAFLLFSFIGTTTSFLAYAIIAAKRELQSNRHGKKSFYYLGGICEGTETTFILILMCVIPYAVDTICLIYGGLCWLTTVERVYRAWRDFCA